jgi:hypothetical protein
MAKRTEIRQYNAEKKRNKGIAKAARERRKTEAKTRQEEYDKLTPEERLERLDKRLGKGVGAVKERIKLYKLIHGEPSYNPKFKEA